MFGFSDSDLTQTQLEKKTCFETAVWMLIWTVLTSCFEPKSVFGWRTSSYFHKQCNNRWPHISLPISSSLHHKTSIIPMASFWFVAGRLNDERIWLNSLFLSRALFVVVDDPLFVSEVVSLFPLSSWQTWANTSAMRSGWACTTRWGRGPAARRRKCSWGRQVRRRSRRLRPSSLSTNQKGQLRILGLPWRRGLSGFCRASVFGRHVSDWFILQVPSGSIHRFCLPQICNRKDWPWSTTMGWVSARIIKGKLKEEDI